MNVFASLKREEGNIFLFTLILLMIMTVMGLSLMTITANTLKTTTTERDDLAVYYIAEAGLVETRSELYQDIKAAFEQVKADYEEIDDPIEKQRFNFDDRFKLMVMDISLERPTKVYEEHFGQPSIANVEIERIINTDSIEFIIKSNGEIGDKRKRTVTQAFDISLNNIKQPTIVQIGTGGNGGGSNNRVLNSCYAVYTEGTMELKGGTINGDVYSSGDITNSNGYINLNGSLYAKGNISLTNGKIERNLISEKNITISNWPTVNGIISAGQNIVVNGVSFKAPKYTDGQLEGGLHLIAKGNIDILSYQTPTLVKYGGRLTTVANYTDPGRSSEDDIDSHMELYAVNFDSGCEEKIPTIEETVFPAYPVLKPAEFIDITVPSNYSGTYEMEIFENSKLSNVSLTNSVNRNLHITLHPRASLDVSSMLIESNRELKLTMTTDNTLYLNGLKINENGANKNNLVIDLNGGNHTIYAGSLEVHGQIELLNPGHLDIYVESALDLKNSRINKNGKAKDISIYYSGSNQVTLRGGSHINSELHVKDANLSITESGNIYGDIFVYGDNQVVVNGGVSAAEHLFIAPKSRVEISGGGKINGNVVAASFSSTGGAIVNAPDPSNDERRTGGGGGGGTTELVIDEYGNAEDMFDFGPQVER